MKRKSSTLDDFDSQYCNRNCINCSTFFLATAMPPFGRTMKIFYRRLYIKRCVFCHFLARIVKFNNVWWSFVFPNFRKTGEFAVSIEHSEAKSVSASGGRSLRPPDPRPGALPLDPAGGSPQTPVIGLRSTRSPWPPLPNPKYATGYLPSIFPFPYPSSLFLPITLPPSHCPSPSPSVFPFLFPLSHLFPLNLLHPLFLPLQFFLTLSSSPFSFPFPFLSPFSFRFPFYSQITNNTGITLFDFLQV